MENHITFEQLPKAVTMLTKEISALKSLLLERSKQQTIEAPEQLLTVEQAAEFLSLAIPTMYSKVSKGELPVMKRGKRLYFSSTELMTYLKEGRRKSFPEIEAEAETYLSQKKKGGLNGI